MGKYFGTDGFRGEANIDLTADHAYKVGRFLGWYFNVKRPAGAEPARIVIGAPFSLYLLVLVAGSGRLISSGIYLSDRTGRLKGEGT